MENKDTSVSRETDRIEPLHYGDMVTVTGRLEDSDWARYPGGFVREHILNERASIRL